MPVFLYKKIGETPKDLIDRYKKENKEVVKASYAGRLDPMANGLMILLINNECKQQDKYLKLNKTYEFDILFGFKTDTYDVLGKLLDYNIVQPNLVENLDIKKYTNRFIQQYPPYSSIVINKQPLWWWSKNNRLHEIKIPEKEVEIYSIEETEGYKIKSQHELEKTIKQMINSLSSENFEKFRGPEILAIWNKFFKENEVIPIIKSYKANVSSGTYIRGIANQIGEELGCGAIALNIKRTEINI